MLNLISNFDFKMLVLLSRKVVLLLSYIELD